MGLYGEHVLPRIINVACGMKAAEPLRRRVCDGLEGDVVEIGFGSGLNVPFYPAAVTRVAAVEPADVGWKLAAQTARRDDGPGAARRASTGSRCRSRTTASTPRSRPGRCAPSPTSPPRSRELRRVLKPGGTLHFVEHGLAPDEGVRRWQHRLEPVQKRLFGGCHLTRPIADLLTDAGFTITELDVFYEEGAPKSSAPTRSASPCRPDGRRGRHARLRTCADPARRRRWCWKNWTGDQGCAPARDRAADQRGRAGAGRRGRGGSRGCACAPSAAGTRSPTSPARDGLLVDTSGMQRVIDADRASGRVTVQAGITLHVAGPANARPGWRSRTRATSTRRRSPARWRRRRTAPASRFGNLSTRVAGMRLVTAAGDVIERDPRRPIRTGCCAARVSLGALGIASQVTLECVPALHAAAPRPAAAARRASSIASTSTSTATTTSSSSCGPTRARR